MCSEMMLKWEALEFRGQGLVDVGLGDYIKFGTLYQELFLSHWASVNNGKREDDMEESWLG